MYIPMRMRDCFNQMTVTDASGNQVPLVKWEKVLHTSKRPLSRTVPPNWIGWFLLVGIILGAAQAWSGHLARRDSRRARGTRAATWGFAAISIFWSFLSGFAGWFLIYA